MKPIYLVVSLSLVLSACDTHPTSCDHRTALDLAGKQHFYGRVANGAPALEKFEEVAEVTGETGDSGRVFCKAMALLADGSREAVFWSFSRASGWPVSAPRIKSCMPTYDGTQCGTAIPPAWDGVPR